MKRFLAAGFALFLLLLLPACRGGSPESTSYGADGELTQAEVRGHYEILFQAAGEEAFGYDETGMGDTEFVGSYEDGAFQLTGPGNLSIGPFYEYQGNYYGFGTMLTPDGITADFWLMR